MRVLLLCAFLFPSVIMGQTVIQQGYTGGNATVGGCTGLNTADVKPFTVGTCVQTGASSSLWVNDCWSNGVGSVTQFQGSTSCSPASVSGLSIVAANVANSTSLNQSFCNIDTTVTPNTYDVFTCSNATAPPTWSVQVNVYAKLLGATNCSGTLAVNPPQVMPTGKCTQLTGTGTVINNGPPNPALYVLANCANGVVTSVMYLTPDCSVQYNSTGQISSVVGPFGPFAQVGAASAVGKPDGAPGSACGVNAAAFLSFTCINTAPTTATPTTTAPTTATPTTTAPTNPPKNGTATSVTVGTAAAAVMLASVAAQLL